MKRENQIEQILSEWIELRKEFEILLLDKKLQLQFPSKWHRTRWFYSFQWGLEWDNPSMQTKTIINDKQLIKASDLTHAKALEAHMLVLSFIVENDQGILPSESSDWISNPSEHSVEIMSFIFQVCGVCFDTESDEFITPIRDKASIEIREFSDYFLDKYNKATNELFDEKYMTNNE